MCLWNNQENNLHMYGWIFPCWIYEHINTNAWNYFFSLIFVKNSPTVPLGSWSSNPLEFLRYLFSLQKSGIFSIFDFFNSVRLFNMANFFRFIAKTPLNSKPLEFLRYLVPFLKYKQFNFRNFNSAPYSVLENVDLKKVFCTLSNVKCLILKIYKKKFCRKLRHICS